MKRTISLLAVLMLIATPVLADDLGDKTASEPGKHRHLGMTLGALGGLILGGWAAAELCRDCDSAGSFIGMWTAFTVGGALGGYAAAGGFSHGKVDVALERGRDAVRRAHAVEALPALRLSSIAGFEEIDLAEPARAELRIAVLGAGEVK